ncbi:zinc ABC transporter substrate-binding protein [bacterium]|nr:zinc ABC transporter substrate-binding protein [bacterium]
MHKRGFQHATSSSIWQFRRLLAAVSLIGASLCLSACPAGESGDTAAGKGKGSAAGQSGAGAEAPHYVVTVKPLELILGRLCEGRATVSTLLEAGANSHTFDPAPSDVQAIAEAGAFIWVGEAYDGWAADFENANSISLLGLLPADMLSPLPEHGEWLPHDDHSGPGHAEHSEPSEDAHAETHEHAEGDHGHEHAEGDHGHEHAEGDHGHEHAEAGHGHAHAEAGHAHDHGELPDPHFYTDPLLVKALLEPLSQRLAQIDPGGAALYQQNAAAFAQQLDTLDAALRERMAPCAGAPVLMFHPSFVYVLKR